MIHDAALADIVTALRSGETSPSAFLETLDERVGAVEPDIQALVTTPAWDQLEDTASDLLNAHPTASARPALFGVPVGVKDIFHVSGLPTRAGSGLPPAAFTGPEATVIKRFRDAGAMVFAKTVTTEFAYFEPGPTRNPHNPNHTPGGSSSGSAAAVAAGLCPLAVGSQTVGSTIRPAAFCGIVGFKPSYGRIPLTGVVPLAESLDHVGLFTQDLPGMQIAAAVACPDWRWLPAPEPRPTLGVPSDAYLVQASRAGRDAFEEQLATLEAAGFELKHVGVFDNIDEINRRHNDLLAAEAALAHHEWFNEYGDRYSDTMAEVVRDGRAIDVDRLAATRTARVSLRQSLLDRMDNRGIDLWVAPAAPGPAPEGIESTGDPAMNLPWTNAGVPVVTVPVGQVEGLPVGLQIAGAFMADEFVLQSASEISAALTPDA